ncbi:MAG TPA: FixH family protein [Ktedonobacteraceae bacterium]|nr:FixH family protein [Ktedonobacteraceae bacterium]
MKRNLIIVGLGIVFLIVMTFIGTVVTEILPHRPTPRVQTAQAGSYQITLQVDPNPPSITQPANLSLQIVHSASRQLVTNARVTLESTMVSMDMGSDRTDAQMQSAGIYLAHVQFSMGGSWQIRVIVATPGAQTESTTFEVVAQ